MVERIAGGEVGRQWSGGRGQNAEVGSFESLVATARIVVLTSSFFILASDF